jgi:hypothetical protein
MTDELMRQEMLMRDLEVIGKAFDVLCQSVSPDVVAPLLAELYDLRGLREEIDVLRAEIAELRKS